MPSRASVLDLTTESGRQDSNLRSSAPKADALATTLRPGRPAQQVVAKPGRPPTSVGHPDLATNTTAPASDPVGEVWPPFEPPRRIAGARSEPSSGGCCCPRHEHRSCQRAQHRRAVESHPGQDHRRGSVRRSEAQHGQGVRRDRQDGEHPWVPAGQGAADGHRPALRSWCRACRRRSTTPSRASTARPSSRTSCRRSRSPSSKSPSLRTGIDRVHRRGGHPARVRATRLLRHQGDRRLARRAGVAGRRSDRGAAEAFWLPRGRRATGGRRRHRHDQPGGQPGRRAAGGRDRRQHGVHGRLRADARRISTRPSPACPPASRQTSARPWSAGR